MLGVTTYANGAFVSIGDDWTVASSPDGTNWMTQQVLGPIFGLGTNYWASAIGWGVGTLGGGGSRQLHGER